MPDSILSQFRREFNSPIETGRQVATVTDRDNISTLRRWEGMLVYVVTDQITYELRGGTDNTFWEPMVGIGEAPEDGQDYIRRDGAWELASSGIPDAPSDGDIYGRMDGAWEIIPEISNYVDLTTAQNVGGVKTFTSRVNQNLTGDSTFFGQNAGASDSAVNNAAAFGFEALQLNTTGVLNTAIGYRSSKNLTGNSNTAIGHNSLLSATASNTNVAVGASSLQNYTSGQSNVGVGFGSFMNLTGGDFNVSLGANAGRYITGGATSLTNATDSIFIGANSMAGASSQTNPIVIGRNATGGGSNTITLGNSSIATLRCQVTSITALSDARDKNVLGKIKNGLEVIKTLNPILFEWNQRDGGKVGKKAIGFTAQDLLKTQLGSSIGGFLDFVDQTNPDRLEARYGHLIPVMVRAIQELNEKMESCHKN